MNAGQLEWIGLRPAHKQSMIEVESTESLVGLGLAGESPL